MEQPCCEHNPQPYNARYDTYHQVIRIRHEARRLDEVQTDSSVILVVDRVFQEEFEPLDLDQEIDGLGFGVVGEVKGNNDVDKLEQIVKGLVRVWIGTIDNPLVVFLSDLPRKTANEFVSPAAETVLGSILGLGALRREGIVILGAQQFKLEALAVLYEYKSGGIVR